MGGPFNPEITPIVAKIHYRSRLDKWHVTVSRQIESGGGAKYEITRQTFDTYAQVLTFISHAWGND